MKRVFCIIPLLFVFFGCGSKPLTIGFVGGLTGKMSDLGISGRNGLRLAVETANEEGGIDGRPVELIVKDDENDPQTAEKAVRQLIDMEVEAIIGHMVSAMTIHTAPIATEHRIPMISPTTSTPALTGIDDYFFRVMPENTAEIDAIVNFAVAKRGISSVSAVIDLSNTAYTEPWWERFKARFIERNGTVYTEFKYNSEKDVNYTEIARDITTGGPEGVVLVTNAFETAMFCQQLAKINTDPQIIPCGWAMTEDLIRYGGGTVEGLFFLSAMYPDLEKEKFSRFKSRYREDFGLDPDFAAINAYNAFTLIRNAYENKKKNESLKEALIRNGEIEGLQGKIRIDEFGDAHREYHVLEIRNGEFELLD